MDSELRRHLVLVEVLLVALVTVGVFIYGQMVPASGVVGLILVATLACAVLYVAESGETDD
jgi:hypothetical protein